MFNAKLRGAIGALAFCLRHSSNSAISEVYKDLWTEVTSSDAFGIPRYLSPIAAKLKEQLCLSQREERLTAGRAVSTIAAHVASTWKDGFSSYVHRRHCSLLYFRGPYRHRKEEGVYYWSLVKISWSF